MRKYDKKSIKHLWIQTPEIPYSLPGEIWLEVINSVVNDIREGAYYVSNYGRFYSLFINTIMRQTFDHDGYYLIGFSTNNGKQILKRAHRVVLQSFCPIQNPEKYEVNHKDSNKINNCVYNLEWVTTYENLDHCTKYGARNKLLKNKINKLNTIVPKQDIPEAFYSSSTLTQEQVHGICAELEKNVLSVEDICEIYRCQRKDVYNILYKGYFNNISNNYKISNYTLFFTRRMLKII